MSRAHRVEPHSDRRWDASFPPPVVAPPDTIGLGEDRPLCFLHIAKTGGTSLTDALARLYPPEQVFSDAGNLTTGYLERLGARLTGRAFLAGHAGQGVAAALEGRADMITLLREPADQAVSNYLHVLSEPNNVLHADAARLSFTDYLRRHHHQIDYQARSLALAIGADPAESDALRHSPHALTDFLESLAFVGVMERMEACAKALSRRLPGTPPISLACMNAAVCRGVSARTLGRLRQDYLDLRDEADLALIFAREARLHQRAKDLLARLEADLKPGSATPRVGFIGAARFHTAQGLTRGRTVVAPLASSARHIIHGPYARMSPGHYQADFKFRLEADGPGRLKLEAACNGDIRLGRRWLSAATWARPGATAIHFTHADAADVLEFRIRAKGFAGGRLIFDGVTITPCAAARAWPSRVWRALSLARRGVRQGLRGLRRARAPSQGGAPISP
jgi:hypothetical protein